MQFIKFSCILVTRFLKKRQQDPDLIHKLGPLLKRNGYTIITENLTETPIGWGSRLNEIIGSDYIRGMKSAGPIIARDFEMSMPEYERILDEISTRFAKAKPLIHTLTCLAQKPDANN
jgi:hypothetical protein